MSNWPRCLWRYRRRRRAINDGLVVLQCVVRRNCKPVATGRIFSDIVRRSLALGASRGYDIVRRSLTLGPTRGYDIVRRSLTLGPSRWYDIVRRSLALRASRGIFLDIVRRDLTLGVSARTTVASLIIKADCDCLVSVVVANPAHEASKY